MPTEDESQLTLQGRAVAAGGAAFVAAAVVNPLDVIKTRIQAQAAATAAGEPGNCQAPRFQCTSTLYESTACHGRAQPLHHCITEQQQSLQRYNQLMRYSHTLSPEAAAWFHHIAQSTANAAAAVTDSAAAATAGTAAAFRRWGITEGPIPVRRTPTAAAAAASYSSGWQAAAAAMRGSQAAGAAALSCDCAAAAAAPGQLPAHSMWETAKYISSREGIPVLWRGTTASLLIAVPMVGIYMPLYDALVTEWSSRLGAAAPVAAGTAARTAACFCVAPFELLRTRVQATAGSGVSIKSIIMNFIRDHTHHHQQQQQQAQANPSSNRSAAARQHQVTAVAHPPPSMVGPRTIIRTVPRLWTGFTATLVRDVPFSALYWAMVEPLRSAMLPKNSHWSPWGAHHHQHQQQQQQPGLLGVNSSSSSSSSSALCTPHPVHHSQVEILVANMVSGFVAGGLAAGITTPFDVVKTRMQIASPSSSSSSGKVWSILRDVYHRDGVEGLFSGVKPRAYRAAPACAIVISVYELLKHWLIAE